MQRDLLQQQTPSNKLAMCLLKQLSQLVEDLKQETCCHYYIDQAVGQVR